MGKITFELIRKKTEHHDGLLEDLEEISLHQLNIDKIETIGRICPKLKILYLQNNIIGKIENIKRLKSMIYLNLALNNITSIPMEISHCEKLRKFDLTVNFIDVDVLESSIDALATLIHLDELYLTGNPCTQVPNYRLYVIHRLPKLEKLDGTDVTRGERIQAKQQFEEIEKNVRQLAATKRKEKGISEEAAAASAASSSSSKDDDDLEEEKEMSFEAKSQKVSAYTPELRLQMHREQEEFDRKKEEDKKKSQKGDQPEDLWKEAQKKMNEKVTVTDGDELPKQRNMAKWDFTIDEKPDAIIVDVAVPRFLDTSLIDIDVHPFWFQVIAKGKNLLLHFPAEVQSNVCKIQRLQINGHLVLTAPKVKKVNTTTHSTTKLNDERATSSAAAAADDEDLDADEDMDAARANLAKVKAMESNVASTHQNVVDLSVGKSAHGTSASSSSTSASNAFQRHQGNSLNQVTTDYRHITKKKDTTGGAHMREIQATRSATLEEARQERLRAEAQSKNNQTDEEVKAELERLGLDDSGVPDLE